MNQQETFWRDTYGTEYLSRNRDFDLDVGVRAWREILRKTEGIETILECGSNVGANLSFLEACLPHATQSIIELSSEAFAIASSNHSLEYAFNGSILESSAPHGAFDLVFTRGVLIHIHPDSLAANMKRMFDYSRRYVMFAEYFSRVPETVEYHGSANQLFKQDFGKYFLDRFPATLIDYGFLWSHVFEMAGFDDVTWWLFRKA